MKAPMNLNPFVVFLVVTLVMGVTPPSHATPSVEQGRVVQALNDARFLSIAIETYALDIAANTGTKHYPTTLDDLVRENYLTEADVTKITKLNKFLLPLGDLPVPANKRVITLMAIYDQNIIIFYSDQSTESISMSK